MTLVVLVRHGETAWNAEHRLQGRADLPLSARGRWQVAAITEVVARYAPTGVTVSPLLRARETAKLLGTAVEPEVDERWQEADLGVWEGRTREELVAEGGEYAAWRAGAFVPAGAEPLADLDARVAGALLDLSARGGCQLVVTHGGPIRAACSTLVGLPPAALVPVSPGSLTVFDTSGPRPRLRAFNLTGQVEEGDAPD